MGDVSRKNKLFQCHYVNSDGIAKKINALGYRACLFNYGEEPRIMIFDDAEIQIGEIRNAIAVVCLDDNFQGITHLSPELSLEKAIPQPS